MFFFFFIALTSFSK